MKLWWKSIGILGFQSRWWGFLRFVGSYLEYLLHGDFYSILGSTLFFQLWKCLKECLLLKAEFEGLRVKCMSWSWCVVLLLSTMLFFLAVSFSSLRLKLDPGVQLWSHWYLMSVGRQQLPFPILLAQPVFEGSLLSQVQLPLHQSPQVPPENLFSEKWGQKRECSPSVFTMPPCHYVSCSTEPGGPHFHSLGCFFFFFVTNLHLFTLHIPF